MTCSKLTGTCVELCICVLMLGGGTLPAQVPLAGSGPGEPVRMINSDRAILEAREERKDLGCEVSPIKPVLGFDLRFHAGYDVLLPNKDVAGSENILTMIFRVAPAESKEDARYFVQHVRVPEMPADAGGNAYLQGSFDVGEGKYVVDWLMRDRTERFCSKYWDIQAELPERDRGMPMQLQPHAIAPADAEQFKEEPPVQRRVAEPLLRVKVLVNFAPQKPSSATFQPVDTSALVAILRSIAREPRIGTFSVVAFNLQEQRILYRQRNADRIDFPALGEAVETLKLGTVDLKRLSQKHGETEFLTGLIQDELGGQDQPDALIFAGPKAMLDENVPTDSLKDVGDVEFPVFYMNFNLQPNDVPWRDAIGRAVKFFRGQEFTITRPRDLWSAMGDIVSRVIQFKSARRVAGAASQ